MGDGLPAALTDAYRSSAPSAGLAAAHHARLEALRAAVRDIGPDLVDRTVDGAALLPCARAGRSAREHRQLVRALTGAHTGTLATTDDTGTSAVGAAAARRAARSLPPMQHTGGVKPAWAQVPVDEALIAAGSWNPAATRALATLRRPPR